MTESDGQNGQEIRALRLTVAQDGSGDYDTVGAALAALGDKEGPPARIYIKKGVYRNGWKLKGRESHWRARQPAAPSLPADCLPG